MNSINKGTDTDASNKEAQEKLLFFNYHEYSLKNYALVGADQEDIHDQALIVTHFPNPYVLRGSKLFHETRVVRIPRLFNYDKFLVPQFSTCLPGGEPAAIVDETSQGFQVKGEFARQFFGTSSSSPLNEYLSDEEFKSIVKGVNELIKRAYNGWSIRNVLLFTLDILSMWFLGDLIRSLTNRPFQELQHFIETKNEQLKSRGVEIIVPRNSAFHSLDFQIKKPKPVAG